MTFRAYHVQMTHRLDITAIIGSRTHTKDQLMQVRALVGPRIYSSNKESVFISGGCSSGADFWCKYFCNQYGRKYLEAPAFWHKPNHGAIWMGAGQARNRLIVDVSNRVIAFWNGASRGTKGAIDYAESIGCPVEIVTI